MNGLLVFFTAKPMCSRSKYFIHAGFYLSHLSKILYYEAVSLKKK